MSSILTITEFGGWLMVPRETPSTSTPTIYEKDKAKVSSDNPSSSGSSGKFLARDMAFAKIVRYLQENGLTAHTDRNGHTVLRKKVLRKKRRLGQGPTPD